MNKMKTVEMNARGQIVIPQEFRKDLKLKEDDTLVVFERDEELIIKKQEDVIGKLISDKVFWPDIAEKSLKKIWDTKEEDEAWKDL